MDSSSLSTNNSHHHHNLDNLPDLVYYYILKNLDLDDLCNVKLVNKNLRSFVDNFKIIELSFVDYDHLFYYHTNNWFSTTKSTRHDCQLNISKLHPLLRNPSNNLLNLKYLRIQYSRSPFKLDHLNKFTQLRILETYCTCEKGNNRLQLSNLVALSIYSDLNLKTGALIVVDAPKLHSLSVGNYLKIDNQIKFNDPCSVKYLRLNYYDKNASVFINLECLEIINGNAQNLNAVDLSKLTNLKKLRFVFLPGSFSNFKELFRSKKDDLQVVLRGVKIKKANKIRDYRMMTTLRFQINNYAELEDDLNFVKDIEYCELVNLLPNQPTDLFTKYTNLQRIQIYRIIKDENRLLNFIKECTNLRKLGIYRSSLSQQFYDRLPVIKSLSNLNITNNITFQKGLKLNFEFIVKMPYLIEFQTDQDVVIGNRLNLNNFRRLKTFVFILINQKFKISKETKDRYVVLQSNLLDLPDQEAFNHDELVKWTNFLRDRNYYGRERRSSKKKKLSIEK